MGSAVLRHVHVMGEQLAAAAVQQLQLELPTFSRPLTARIRGVSAHVQQVKLPKVRWEGGSVQSSVLIRRRRPAPLLATFLRLGTGYLLQFRRP